MIRAVLFDLDGTLCDTLQDLGEAVNAALREAGYPEHPIESYRWKVGNGMKKLIERAVPPEVSGEEETVERIRRREMEYYGEHLLDYTLPYRGMREAVEELRETGLLLYVVTNKPQPMAQRLADTLFPDCFTEVFGQRPERKTKPDPWAILEAMEHGGFSREECFFIGDSNVDVQTAKNGAVPCIGVTWGFRGRQELETAGADLIAETAEEMNGLILGKR